MQARFIWSATTAPATEPDNLQETISNSSSVLPRLRLYWSDTHRPCFTSEALCRTEISLCMPTRPSSPSKRVGSVEARRFDVATTLAPGRSPSPSVKLASFDCNGTGKGKPMLRIEEVVLYAISDGVSAMPIEERPTPPSYIDVRATESDVKLGWALIAPSLPPNLVKVESCFVLTSTHSVRYWQPKRQG